MEQKPFSSVRGGPGFPVCGTQAPGSFPGRLERVFRPPSHDIYDPEPKLDQNGVFTIKAIAPGSYKLYAFENVPEDVWLVPDFLKEVESFGITFKAAEGDLATIQLPLVGKVETARILAKLGIEN